jgi:hypothetical protein
MATSHHGSSEPRRSKQSDEGFLPTAIRDHVLEIEESTDDDSAADGQVAESPMTKRLRLERKTGKKGGNDLKLPLKQATATLARPKSQGNSVVPHRFSQAPRRINGSSKRGIQPSIFAFAPLNFQSGFNAETEPDPPSPRDW